MERTATCHCGQLRVIATGEPERVYVCHCKACQHRTGSIIHNGSSWRKSQVRVEGEDKIYARMADSGFEIRFHFCPHCGTSVFWEGDKNPATVRRRGRVFRRPRFPAPGLVGLGGGDAFLARTAARDRALPAIALLRSALSMNGNPYETGLDRNAANYVPLSPIGFLRRSAAVYPNRISVIHGERRYTWRQSLERCRRLASALARRTASGAATRWR